MVLSRASCTTAFAAALVAVFVVNAQANAGSIVQSGSLSGTGAPMTQPLVLDQYDDLGGTQPLNSVRLDLLTSVRGGYTMDGSNVPVHIFAQLDAEYSLNGTLLADTQAVIDTIVPNDRPLSATVFGTDAPTIIISDPTQLTPWIGTGTVTLDVFTELQVSEDPVGIIHFSAGGTVSYTVTYDFGVVPAPGSLALLAGLGIRRRRRRPAG